MTINVSVFSKCHFGGLIIRFEPCVLIRKTIKNSVSGKYGTNRESENPNGSRTVQNCICT